VNDYIDHDDRRGVPGWWQPFGDVPGSDGDSLKVPDIAHGYLQPHIPQWALDSGHYAKYMETLNWRTLRRRVMKRAKKRCEMCWALRLDAIHSAQHVHHMTYERLFFERLTDLLAVCYTCHSVLHPGNDNLAENTDQDVLWDDSKRYPPPAKKKRRLS
jgi:hypothetical protein